MNNKAQAPGAEARYEYVNCDLCGEDDTELRLVGRDRYNNLPGEFKVVKCRNCGMVFTNPRPCGEELARYYPDEAGYFQPLIHTEENIGSIRKITRRIYNDTLTEYLGYFPDANKSRLRKVPLWPVFRLYKSSWERGAVPRFVRGGRLLEVGCSYGPHLKQMKDLGWEVTGIEPNKKAADFGNRELGLNIINDSFENTSLGERFDVIILLMVLEHVPSPSATLAKLISLLKQDGQLIITVPDFSGVEFRLFKEYCYALHLPNHLNFFTPATMKKYCQKYGLKIEKIRHHKFDRDFIASARYMKDDGVNGWLAPVLSNGLFRKTVLRAAVTTLSCLGMTSRMTVWARAS